MIKFILALLIVAQVMSIIDSKPTVSHTTNDLEAINIEMRDSTADEIHERALGLANSGNLEGALPYFKMTTKVDPKKDTYWSNLGVTQMRLNLLDDALLSFTKGMKLNPQSSLILENINALQEHMVHREQVGPEEDILKERDSEPVKRTKKNLNKNRKTNDERINEWFGPWWEKRDELVPIMKDALVNFRPVQIRNFLRPEMALALHKELYESSDYQVYESYNRWYQFHFNAIYQHNEHYQENVLLAEISDVMHFQEVRDWVQEISDSEVNGSTLAGAAYYAAGDYTMPHTDKAGGGGGDKEKRRIAYILHLTKDWNPKYGGDMVWMNPAYHVHPSFNCMTLFSVSQSSWHFVSPVAAITPPDIKRLAFNGWWTSINRRQADEIEAKQNDELRLSTFGTVIDGVTSRPIPHLQAYENMDGLWVNHVK